MQQRATSTSLVVFVGAVAVGLGVAAAIARPLRRPPLDVIPGFDVDRYMGTWYEIARMPLRFERGCTDVSAHYRRRRDGTVEVTNRCLRRRGASEVHGRGWVVDSAVPARLAVQFQWPFRGDYEVLYVDGDYRVAVVGSRNRRNAWILCRDPHLDDETYQLCCEFLAEQGFDPGRLIRTPHTQAARPPAVYPTATASP